MRGSTLKPEGSCQSCCLPATTGRHCPYHEIEASRSRSNQIWTEELENRYQRLRAWWLTAHKEAREELRHERRALARLDIDRMEL